MIACAKKGARSNRQWALEVLVMLVGLILLLGV